MPNIKKDGNHYDHPVIVITQHKGVIFGYMNHDDVDKRSFPLMKTKVAIDWGTTKGVNELADTGPTVNSMISAEADAPMIHDVIKIISVKRSAENAWINA